MVTLTKVLNIFFKDKVFFFLYIFSIQNEKWYSVLLLKNEIKSNKIIIKNEKFSLPWAK
jgi:hypothetical protein